MLLPFPFICLTSFLFIMKTERSPDMSESPQESRRKKARRDRVQRACDLCRRSHVKCDAIKPVCTRCKSHNKPCLYTLPEPEVKKKPPKAAP